MNCVFTFVTKLDIAFFYFFLIYFFLLFFRPDVTVMVDLGVQNQLSIFSCFLFFLSRIWIFWGMKFRVFLIVVEKKEKRKAKLNRNRNHKKIKTLFVYGWLIFVCLQVVQWGDSATTRRVKNRWACPPWPADLCRTSSPSLTATESGPCPPPTSRACSDNA